jgi:hypothetical protein
MRVKVHVVTLDEDKLYFNLRVKAALCYSQTVATVAEQAA